MVQIQTVLALISMTELLKRKQSSEEEFYKEKEWRIIYVPILYDTFKLCSRYNKKGYYRKNYLSAGDEENARLIYDYDRNVYKLKLGRWEGENKCDWNKMLRCIYIGPGNEKMRKKTFDEIKETLVSVKANEVEVKMK